MRKSTKQILDLMDKDIQELISNYKNLKRVMDMVLNELGLTFERDMYDYGYGIFFNAARLIPLQQRLQKLELLTNAKDYILENITETKLVKKNKKDK